MQRAWTRRHLAAVRCAAVGGEHAVPAGIRKLTFAFNFTGERAVCSEHRWPLVPHADFRNALRLRTMHCVT
jgi:hypothetical protein